MNGAQLHLALNHLPVVTTLLTFIQLLWAWKIDSSELKRISLSLVVLAALFSCLAYLSGDPARDLLESLPNFSKEFVHNHEEAGEVAFISSIVCAIFAILALVLERSRSQVAHYSYLAVIALTLITTFIYFRVAHLGGLIRHEEIRSTSEN